MGTCPFGLSDKSGVLASVLNWGYYSEGLSANFLDAAFISLGHNDHRGECPSQHNTCQVRRVRVA
jgi:hypothetical protein